MSSSKENLNSNEERLFSNYLLQEKSAHGSQQVSSPMNKYRLSAPVSYQGQPPLIMCYTFYFSHSLLSNPGNTRPSLPQLILKQLEEKTTSHEEFWREDNSTKTLFSCLKNVIFVQLSRALMTSGIFPCH